MVFERKFIISASFRLFAFRNHLYFGYFASYIAIAGFKPEFRLYKQNIVAFGVESVVNNIAFDIKHHNRRGIVFGRSRKLLVTNENGVLNRGKGCAVYLAEV